MQCVSGPCDFSVSQSLFGLDFWTFYCGLGLDNLPISGQTSCWPCPANTTTDMAGASSLAMCKSHACPFYAKVSSRACLTAKHLSSLFHLSGGSWDHGVTKLPQTFSGDIIVTTLQGCINSILIYLQTGAECRWRVSPGHTRRVLLILPR